MVNKDYIKELLIDLFNNTKNKEFSIFISKNVNKSEEKDFYTIYIYMKRTSKYLNFDIENIYPLQHIIGNTAYIYNNLIYDEIYLLRCILESLDINVSLISNNSLIGKIEGIKSNHLAIKTYINSLKENNETKDQYVSENNIKSILNELMKINLFI